MRHQFISKASQNIILTTCGARTQFPELKTVKDPCYPILKKLYIYICMYVHRHTNITHKTLPIIQREAIPFSTGSHYSILWQNYFKRTLFIYCWFRLILLQKATFEIIFSFKIKTVPNLGSLFLDIAQ